MSACVPKLLQMRASYRWRSGSPRRMNRSTAALAILLVVGCSSEDLAVRGRVSADSTPVDSGTITFQQADRGRPTFGTAVRQGAFDFGKQKGFIAGTYHASVEGFQPTGRMINDYQRGAIPEMAPLVLSQNSIAVSISAENAQGLELDFHKQHSR